MTNDGAGLQERMRITANGRLGVGTAAPDSLLHLASSGPINLKLEADTDNTYEADNARILFSQDGGATTARVGYAAGGNVFEITQEQANKLSFGVNDRTVFEVGASTVQVKNVSENRIVTMGPSAGESGVIEVYGSAGSLNVLVSNYGDERGVIQIYDESGTAQAGMYINASGQGVVFADSKQFRVKNPADPSTDICYTSLEGPEAAAYFRGTATLTEGQATIELPPHFQAVASDHGMTVSVTPLSETSAGLAVTEKTTRRVKVRELNGGKGTYDFDYMITAVRKGHEGFQVIQSTRLDRPTSNARAATPPPSSAD